jgi:hypothetical protein
MKDGSFALAPYSSLSWAMPDDCRPTSLKVPVPIVHTLAGGLALSIGCGQVHS